jgi:hypothetical protein
VRSFDGGSLPDVPHTFDAVVTTLSRSRLREGVCLHASWCISTNDKVTCHGIRAIIVKKQGEKILNFN